MVRDDLDSGVGEEVGGVRAVLPEIGDDAIAVAGPEVDPGAVVLDA